MITKSPKTAFVGYALFVVLFLVPLAFSVARGVDESSDGVLLRPAEINMSTSTATQEIGYVIDITGNLASEGKPIPSAKIFLLYAVGGEDTWTEFTAVTTDLNGTYSASWFPTATGLFTLSAEFSGNTEYAPTQVVKNISVLQPAGKNLFFVESNSTLTSLAFNSISNEISFNVSGPQGTTGYVKFVVAKELMPDASALKVFLDGKQLQFTLASYGDNWFLTFQYLHSTHLVVISIPQPSNGDTAFPITSVAIIALAVAVTLGFVALYRNHKNKRT